MTATLTSEHIDSFRRDGFAVLRGFFDRSAVRRFESWAVELQEAPETVDGVWKYYDEDLKKEGRRVLSRIEYIRKHHAGFRALMEGDLLRGLVAELLGEPVVPFKDKINFKLPGGSGFAPHQDIQAGWDRYCTQHITAMISIDETTVENGCLEMAPGHREQRLRGDSWRPLEGDELVEFTPIPSQPGDVFVFDSYAPHQSGPNRTDRPRRVLYLTYNPASQGDHYEQYFADKWASYPPDVARDADREYRFRV